MKTYWRTILIMIGLLGVMATGPLQADNRHGHRPSPGNGHASGHHGGYHHGYSGNWSFSGGFYAPFYGWGYGPGYYGPGYPSLGLGYSWGGYHDAFGLSLSLPLYFGSRSAPDTPPYPPYGYTAVQPAGHAIAAPVCLQTREYTTEITIGDELKPAYGTACLQADGSWKVISGPVIADQ
jgi:hypothetical protein